MKGPQVVGIGLPSPGWHCGHVHAGPTSSSTSVLTHPGPRASPSPDPRHTQPAVVTELEDIVGVRGHLGAHDRLKQGVCQLLPIHMKLALKEPVSAVLTEGIKQRKEGRTETGVVPQCQVLSTAFNSSYGLFTLKQVKIHSKKSIIKQSLWIIQSQHRDITKI